MSYHLYICECGPIMAEGLDLDFIEEQLRKRYGDLKISRHGTICSDDGQEWLAQEMTGAEGVIFAGCSPREHEHTLRKVCRKGGVNPYKLAVANIREQCAWVHEDKMAASEKALLLIVAAIERCKVLEPLEEHSISVSTNALVIGAGVAGMSAARLLAEGGRQVIVVEKSPAIGGVTALIDEAYPNYECASCMLEPLMDEVLHNENIEVLTCSEVIEVLGAFGAFTVKVRKTARHVDASGCYGCSTCHASCPVNVPREADEGLSQRNAIYIPYVGALPNVSVIDEKSCLYFKDGSCRACADNCPFGAIDLDEKSETVEFEVGGVIAASGCESVRLELPKAEKRVLSARAFERLLNPSGPTAGELVLPSGIEVSRICLIHSMTAKGGKSNQAGSELCCSLVQKFVHQLRKRAPRCKISELLFRSCGPATNEPIVLGDRDKILGFTIGEEALLVHFERNGTKREIETDLAVYLPEMCAAKGAKDLYEILGAAATEDGYFAPDHPSLRPFETTLRGLYSAGTALGPRTIRSSAVDGAAAAGRLLAALVPGKKVELEPAVSSVNEVKCGHCRSCALVCPYKAISYDETEGHAVIDKRLCRGCGSCAATCPASAISALHSKDEQLTVELDVLLSSNEHTKEE